MKRIALILCGLTTFFLSNSSKGQAWETFGDISGNALYRHDDVYFTSGQVGYTVYYNADAAVKTGTIFKTTNAGVSWNPVKVSPGTHFRCITFLDAQTGIAGNLGKGSFDNTTDTIPLYRTTDGGQTWTGMNPDPANLKGLCALFKVNDNTIYGAGRVRGPAHFLKSNDKGATWEVKALKPFGMGAATDLYFINPDTGFVVGMDSTPYATGASATYKGKVLYTTNGGQSWTSVINEPLNPTYFWKIHFPTRKTGYVTLQQNTTTYTTVVYYKTIDGGLNWNRFEIPTSLFGLSVNFLAQGIGFIRENLGWIGGGGFETNFFQTQDGGTTWTNATSTFSYRINKLRRFGDTMYAAGIRIHRWTDPTLSVAENDNGKDNLVTVFPNPFQNEFTIRIESEEFQNGLISLHSANGAEIWNQEAQKENRIQTQNLPNGIYFLKVKSGEKVWFRRIVKD